ncbi:MAG TPA: UvrB/UvrC motif-containing protein [Gemmatales bacterium]|nr:UvrB/UvrC motif-containing protein [Gemmatales bacterium]HMP58039.1 UvrB/UvrC motif-containing protein [Gemmatales bacterium]
MAPLFRAEPFAGFGPSRFLPGLANSLTRLEAESRVKLGAAVRAQCPSEPGVYGMVDAQGELLYVGKAKRLRARLLGYFRPKSADAAKARRLLRRTRCLVWEPLPHEVLALVRELELIRRWRPRFNIMGQPRRRQRLYLALGRAPAPYLFLAPELARTMQHAFGPIPNHAAAHAAVQVLNEQFRLRDCPRPQTMVFKEDRALFPESLTPGCLRHEIDLCLAPCAGLCSRRQYGQQARQALAFLTGQDRSLLASLKGAMRQAAASAQYELAARCRDQLQSLDWLVAALQRTAAAQAELNGVYRLDALDGTEWWGLLRDGQFRSLEPRPRDSAGRARMKRELQRVFRATLRVADSDSRPADVSVVWLLASWFRKYPDERQRLLSVTDANALLA